MNKNNFGCLFSYILQSIGVAIILTNFTLIQAIGILLVIISSFVWINQKYDEILKVN